MLEAKTFFKKRSRFFYVIGIFLVLGSAVLWFFLSWRTQQRVPEFYFEEERWERQRPELRAQLSWLESAIEEGFNQNEVNRIFAIIKTNLKANLSQSEEHKDQWKVLEPLLSDLGDAVVMQKGTATELINKLQQALSPEALARY